ncbi:GATA-binding factor C [Trichonephila clavata]|uniref:GATA-binding factor C n=1 Tax=Trichonephila clavata TaxID=2740835 RepID=A0A8X6G0Y8_TRICU|nr:GATA-binding factor C [Trichonephila clavata]
MIDHEQNSGDFSFSEMREVKTESVAVYHQQCTQCGAFEADTDSSVINRSGNYICDNCIQRVQRQNLRQQNKKKKKGPALSRRSDQICCNCKTQKTSLWRRSQNGEFICNPCGLYYKLHNRDRPQEMRKDSIQTRNRNKPKNANRKKASNNSPPETVPISPPGPSFTILRKFKITHYINLSIDTMNCGIVNFASYAIDSYSAVSRRSDQICCNCKTQSKTLWRRSQNGEFICNPCGLYYKLHNRDRPQEMRKDSIQTRNRNKPKNANRKKASNNSPPETVPISPPGPSFTILRKFKITHYINLSIDTMNCGIVNFASYAIDSYSVQLSDWSAL